MSVAAYPTDAPREKQLRARVIPPKLNLWESTHLSLTPASQSKGIYGELVLLAVLVRRVSQALSSSVISAPLELIPILSREGCMNTVTG